MSVKGRGLKFMSLKVGLTWIQVDNLDSLKTEYKNENIFYCYCTEAHKL